MRSLILSILFFSIIGCTTTPKQSTKDTETKPTVQEGSDLIELKLNALTQVTKKADEKGNIFLELGVIPGAIYGAPLNQPKWYVDLYNSSKPTFNYTAFEDNFKLYAKSLIPNKYSADLKVEPANTQFVRASTFGIDFKEKKHLSGGLINDDGDFLFLMYFDRACKITGDNDFGNEGIFRHEIDIPKAGLYRVVVRGEKGGLLTVTAEQSNEPLIVRLR